MNRLVMLWGVAIAVVVYAMYTLPRALQVANSPFAVVQYLLLTWGIPVAFLFLIRYTSLIGIFLLGLFMLNPEIYMGGRLIPVFYLAMWPIGLLIVLQSAIKKEPPLARDMISFLWISYVSIALIAYFRNPVFTTMGTTSGSGFRAYFIFFSMFLLYLILPKATTDRHLTGLPRIVIGISLSVIILKTFLFFFGHEYVNILVGVPPHQWLVEGRWTFLDHASFFLLIATLAEGIRQNTGIGRKAWLFALTGLALLGCSMTGTRTSLLAAGITLLATMFVRRAWVLLISITAGFLILSFTISNVAINSNSPLAPFQRSFSMPWMNLSNNSANIYTDWDTYDWRKGMWDYCIRKIKEKPILGNGFFVDPVALEYTTGYTRAYRYSSELTWLAELGSGATHNLWLGPFLSFGFLGGLLFIAYALQRAVRIRRLLKLTQRDHPYQATVHMLFLWLIFILASSYTTGGTKAINFFMFAALSHLVEMKVQRIPGQSMGPTRASSNE